MGSLQDWEGVELLNGMSVPDAKHWAIGLTPGSAHLYFPGEVFANAWKTPELNGLVPLDLFFNTFQFNNPGTLRDWINSPKENVSTLEFSLETNGTLRWLRADRWGFKEGKILFIREITLEKERELNLRRQIDLLDMISRKGRVGAWMVDLDDNKVYWSEETCRIHETPPGFSPMLEEALLFYKEGECREKVAASVKRAINHAQPYDIEAILITATGKEVTIRTWGEAIFIDGVCTRLRGTIQVVDHNSLLVPQKKLDSAPYFDSAPNAIAVFSSDSAIISANKRFQEVFGVSAFNKLIAPTISDTNNLSHDFYLRITSTKAEREVFSTTLQGLNSELIPIIAVPGEFKERLIWYVFEVFKEKRAFGGVYANPENFGASLLNLLDSLEIPAFCLQGSQLNANEALNKLGFLHYDENEEQGLNLLALALGSDGLQRISSVAEDVQQTGTPRRIEFELQQDEHQKVLEFSAVRVDGFSRDAPLLIFTVSDNSELRKLSSDMDCLQAEYREVFNATQSALFILQHCSDGQFRYLRNNHTHAVLTGLSSTDMAGKTPRELLGDSLGTQIEENYSLCLASSKPRTYLEELDLPGGKRNWRTTLTPVYHDNLTFIVGSAHDITEEYSLLKQLKSSQEKFLVMAELGNDLLFTINPKGEFEYLSPNWERLTGFSSEDLLGKQGWSLVHPDDLKMVMSVFEKLDGSEPSNRVEYRVVHKDGHLLWHSSSGSPLNDEHGKLKGWFVVVRDITDIKEREIQATQLNNLLEESQSLAHIGSWQFNLATKEVQWSAEVFKILELPPDSTIPSFEYYLSVWKQGDKQEIEDSIAKTIKSQTVDEAEHILTMPDGELKYVKNWSAPGYDDNGKLTHIRGAIMDITESRQQQNNLERLRNQAQEIARQYRSILESQSVYVVKTDIEGNYTYYNTYFAGRFQRSSSLLGSSTMRSIIPEDHVKCAETVKLCLENPDVSYEVVLRKKGADGKLYHGRWEFKATADRNGVVKEMVCVGFDISREAENLAQSLRLLNSIQSQNARLNEFTQIVSHNLRSHASNIKALAEMWLASDKAESPAGIAQKVLISAERLDETLHNLNEILSSANPREDYANRFLREEVDKTIQILQPSIQQAGAICENQINDTLIVKVIPGYLDSILLNLLTNALKYADPAKPRAEIVFRAHVEAHGFCIEIQDNGLGIDLEKNGHRLFGMYQTFHKHPDARGFGLFLVKNQVEALHGRIDVESEPGKGSVFRVYLPLKQVDI
jgi:PAS domain S-box-containing protein